MNRYDIASVAKFSPLSFNELAAAPTMMRKKHDASIAQAEAMRIKTDPYSKHYNRALELKQQMDNEIAKNVDTLNKEGYNPTTFQNITKLNRQYNDMISPTGEIGQINAENINIKKINEEYDKLGKEKNWGQETVNYWKNKALKEYNEKPLYDANGRILTYSGPEGIVNKVDYNKRLHELASSAKMSVSEFSNAVTKLGMDEKSGYNVANKNSEAHKLGDNYARVKDAYDTLKKEIYDPTSEVHKSMRYEGRDPKSLLDILKTQSDIYRQNVKSDEYSTDINPFGPGPGSSDGSNPQGGGIFGEDYNTKEVGGKNQDYSDLEKIGKSFGNTGSVGSSYSMGTDTSGGPKQKSGKFTSADIKDPRQKALYEKVFKNATTGKGIMLDGKLVHLSKDMQKFGKDDPRVAAQILRSIKQNPAITLTSKLLTTNQVLNDQGFVAGLGTTADDVDKNIRRQLQRNDASGRKLVDPETGKTISWNDAAKEYGFENINDVNYQGQISAHNWEEDNDKLGSNSSFSPHVVTIKDKKGKWHSFKTTRLNSDNIGGNVARQNDLTKNYRNATVNYGDFVDFESSSNNLKGIQVKYNPNEQEYDSRTGEPKTWTIKFKNKVEEKATESQYMNWVNSIK